MGCYGAGPAIEFPIRASEIPPWWSYWHCDACEDMGNIATGRVLGDRDVQGSDDDESVGSVISCSDHELTLADFELERRIHAEEEYSSTLQSQLCTTSDDRQDSDSDDSEGSVNQPRPKEDEFEDIAALWFVLPPSDQDGSCYYQEKSKTHLRLKRAQATRQASYEKRRTDFSRELQEHGQGTAIKLDAQILLSR